MYIDVAKGIGMSMIVWMHIWGNNTFGFTPPQTLNSLIRTIYVPVFFVLSGFLLEIQDLDLRKEITKKAKSLLRPFAIVYLFSFSISVLLDMVGFKAKHEFEWINFLSPLYSKTFFNGPIWFLLALFWAFTIYYCIMKLCKGKEQYVVVSTLCISLVGFNLHRWGITLPLFFGQGMVASSMLMMGSEIRKYLMPVFVSNRRMTIICFILCFGIYLLFRQNLGFQENIFDGHFPVFMIGVFGGSLMILCFSFLLEKYLSLFAYWCRFSLVVLCLHNFILIPISKITGVLVGNSIFWAILNFVMIYMVFMGIIPLVTKLCPGLFNIKKQNGIL